MMRKWYKNSISIALLNLITTLVFLGSAIGTPLQGQSPYAPRISDPISETWRWHSMEILSAKGVRSMTDDNQGNMWFGLNKGIMQYDGYSWTTFDDKPCLMHPVGVLFNSEWGQLFAGSESGLLKFRNGHWEKVFPLSDSLNIPVTSITKLPNETIVAGLHEGMLVFNNEETTIYTVLSKADFFRKTQPGINIIILPDELLFQRNFGRIDDIYIENNDRFWIFMSRNNDGKIFEFKLSENPGEVIQQFVVRDELDGTKLSNRNQLLRAQNGNKWIINGFYKSGILRKSGKKWEQLKLSDTFGGDELHTDIMEVSDGSLWIGGLGKLFVYKNEKWNVFSGSNLPVPSSRIIFHESRDGYIWIAGIQGDVFRLSYKPERWIRYLGLNFQFHDNEGRDWYISVDNKIVVNENSRWYAYDAQNGLIDAPVRLTITRKGSVWVAGSHKGIAATAYLKNNQWFRQQHRQLSWGIDPRSVFQDKEGSLWFGASVDRQEALGQISGILQLKNPDGDIPEWRHHTQQDGITQHNVYGIGQSPDGDIWAGGTNLLRYDQSRWRPISNVEYLNEFVDIVHSRKNLWVGSRYYGLFRFDGKDWTQFTKSQGLPSNTIISIFEEKPDLVWVVTDKDIAWFDGATWNSDLFPEDFRIPREGGDMQVADDGSVWINKSLREWKRRSFPFSIAPPEAMDEFWTVRYTRGSMPPKTHINIFTEKVDPSGNTFISWSGSDHWEETPDWQLTFSYRLNEGEWSDFSKENSIVLTNLKSGRHVFEVIARDLDNNIEPLPALIQFTVSPPIWKQGWFIFLVISFLIIIGFYEARLIQRNRSLFKLNVSLTDVNKTLESRQQKIQLQKEKIEQQKEELERKNVILEEKNTEISLQRDKLEEMVEKVEELSSVKQRFFTNISHEFRTPLTLILGSIEQLLASQNGKEKASINRAYETIQRSSRRILRLINQILEIRKIETAKIHLNITIGDIVAFSKEIVSLFNDLASHQKIKLDFSSPFTELPALFDHDKLEKILFNLLSNAFKSTPSGGSVTLTLEKKTVPVSNIDEYDKNQIHDVVAFRIEDTGKGIPRQFQNRIFDRFYQVNDSDYHQKIDGSGIGLSYVKDLVSIHHGNIGVESEPGKGSTFFFEIPYELPEQTETFNPANQSYIPSQIISDDLKFEAENMARNVVENTTFPREAKQDEQEENDKPLALIVEDEYELRKFIKEILEADFEVIDAVNGQEGYEQALEYQPDIIISDVMMPEMNGIEMCQKLKGNLATNHIPLVLLTARTAPENKLEGYQTGADAYIEKPFNMEFLKIRINNLILAKNKTRDKVLRDLITQPGEVMVHSEDDKMIGKIKEVLEENISNPDFDVETMSQQFCLSRFHFSRKIKQITGLTPKEIIDSYRLKRAGQILTQNKISISEVAYMVGFDHPNSFTRAFRKYYNMTPTEYASQN